MSCSSQRLRFPAPIFWIAAFFHSRALEELLGIVFDAQAISHGKSKESSMQAITQKKLTEKLHDVKDICSNGGAWQPQAPLA